jgi:hypothetical protein
VDSGEQSSWRLAPLAVSLGALLVLGLVVPPPLMRLLAQITEIVGP